MRISARVCLSRIPGLFVQAGSGVQPAKSSVWTIYSRNYTASSSTAYQSSDRFKYLLIALPITAFALGTWQVQRRSSKLELIEAMSSKLLQEPLTTIDEITNVINASEVAGDSMPVKLTGFFDHAQEMLIGPRQLEGQTGFHLVTPFCDGEGRCMLINRGWISKNYADQASRPLSLAKQPVTVSGLIRRKTAQNYFTPKNDYVHGQYYHVDIDEMSKRTRVLPILVEVTIDTSFATDNLEKHGIPVGKPHEVPLRNNHLQYIVTWSALPNDFFFGLGADFLGIL